MITDTMVPLSICSFIEVSLACICASLATLRPLLQKFGLGPRSSAAPASDEGEAGSKLWDRHDSETVDERKQGEVEVFAWHSEERGEVVELQAFGASLPRSELASGGYR